MCTRSHYRLIPYDIAVVFCNMIGRTVGKHIGSVGNTGFYCLHAFIYIIKFNQFFSFIQILVAIGHTFGSFFYGYCFEGFRVCPVQYGHKSAEISIGHIVPVFLSRIDRAWVVDDNVRHSLLAQVIIFKGILCLNYLVF